MRHEDVDVVRVHKLRGRLTVRVGPPGTAVDVTVETGPFTEQAGVGMVDIHPQGYDPYARPSAGIRVGGSLTISSSGGGVAAGVIHGPVRVGSGGVEVGPSASNGPVDGSITVVAPPGTSFRLLDCHGSRTGPGDEQHDMEGDDRFTT